MLLTLWACEFHAFLPRVTERQTLARPAASRSTAGHPGSGVTRSKAGKTPASPPHLLFAAY